MGKHIIWLSVCIGWAAITFFSGCDEELAGDIGKEILPPEELVNIVYSDTFSIVMNTQTRDSVPTCNAQLQMFGTYNDPLMGKIDAATYFEALTTNDSLWDPSRPQDLKFDSLVLQLSIFSWYGDFQTPQQVEVYQLAETMPSCENLFSSTSLALDRSKELSNGYFIDFSEDNTISGSFRISLDSTLGNKFLSASAENFATDENFKEFFPGLYVTSTPVSNGNGDTGGIYLFQGSTETSTRLILYYQSRSDSTSEFVPRIALFPIGVSPFSTRIPKKFVQINRSNTEGTELEKSLNGGNELEFVQAGSYLEIEGQFPSLRSLPRETGVNLAELVLKVDTAQIRGEMDTAGIFFRPPTALEILLLDSNGDPISVEGIPTPQIPFNSTRGVYEFPFTPFLQQVLINNIEEYTFLVRPLFQTSINSYVSSIFNQSIRRAVIGGVDHPTLAPELRITYTTPQ